jgi:hypothetical protein
MLGALALCTGIGCRPDVVVHPPAAEERYVSAFPSPVESYLAMNHPAAGRSIISGVEQKVVDGSRWAEHRAVLRFHSIPLDELRFHAAFVLPETLMARAGRVVLRVAIAGEPAHEAEYTEAGPQEIQEKIPKGSLTFDSETQVVLEMAAPAEHIPAAEIRYLLTSAGFRF